MIDFYLRLILTEASLLKSNIGFCGSSKGILNVSTFSKEGSIELVGIVASSTRIFIGIDEVHVTFDMIILISKWVSLILYCLHVVWENMIKDHFSLHSFVKFIVESLMGFNRWILHDVSVELMDHHIS